MANRLTVVSNLIWRFFERCGAQLVSFVVTVVLARLIEPDVFGLVSIVTIITSILMVFVDSGMANSLIQKKNSDSLDFSSVFYFNVAFCLLLYLGLFLSAPLIASAYGQDQLRPVIRVLGLTVVVAGVKNVQQAYVAKTLQFKRFFFSTLGGTILAGAAGLILALNGAGVWALVAKELINVTVSTLILWLTVGWRPERAFSAQRLSGLLSYGWKLLASGLLDTVYNRLQQLLIGARYSQADLAFYDRGNSIPNLIVENVNSSIDSVLLPVLSGEQDNREHVRDMTRRAIKISTYVMMPMMTGLALCAEPLVRLLLTDKWLPCVPFLRIFCFSYAFYPIHTANLNAIKAVGRSDLFLSLEIIKKVIGVAALIYAAPRGVYPIALTLVFMTLVSQVINAWPNGKLLGYAYPSQLRDMLPALLLSCLMGLPVWALSLTGLGDWALLPLQVLTGAAVYIAASAVFKVDSFGYVLGIARRILSKKGGTEE